MRKKTTITYGERHRAVAGAKGEFTIEYYVWIEAQPWVNYLIFRLYHFYDMRIFKVPGFKKLEDLGFWVHRLRCNDDCMTGQVWRRTPGSTAPGMEDGVTTVETYCAHMPWGASQDCRCFDLQRKNTTLVAEFPLSEPEWERLKKDRPSARELTALLG